MQRARLTGGREKGIRCAPGVRHRTARRTREEGIRTRCISFLFLSLSISLSLSFSSSSSPSSHLPAPSSLRPISLPNPVSPPAIPPRSSYVSLGSILQQTFRYFFVSLLCDL